jgi:hypothetical protein
MTQGVRFAPSPVQAAAGALLSPSQSRHTVRRHHGRQSSAIFRQYLLAARRITVFKKAQQCEKVTVVIVIGLMMEAQTAIWRSRKQKNAGTLSRLDSNKSRASSPAGDSSSRRCLKR